jgi:hypothetical protein
VSERKPRGGIAGEHVVPGGREPFAESGEKADRVGYASAGEGVDSGLQQRGRARHRSAGRSGGRTCNAGGPDAHPLERHRTIAQQ